jgi:hypothetical protein
LNYRLYKIQYFLECQNRGFLSSDKQYKYALVINCPPNTVYKGKKFNVNLFFPSNFLSGFWSQGIFTVSRFPNQQKSVDFVFQGRERLKIQEKNLFQNIPTNLLQSKNV